MSNQGQHTLHDTAMGWGIILGVLVAVFFLFWYFFANQVKSAFLWWRWQQMWLASLIYDEDYTVDFVANNGQVESRNLHEWVYDIIPTMEAADLNAYSLNIVSTMAMEPFKPIAIGLFVLMAIWVVVSGPGTQFRNQYNLDGIIGAMSRIFPVIIPFIKFNPANQPPRPPGSPVPAELPPFAEALGPEEWVAYNQIPVPDGKINQQASYMAFARQLGGRWQGPIKMAPHKQILLAAFCLKAKRKRKEADELLGRLAICWSHKNGLQLGKDKSLQKEALKILRNRDMAKLILSRCNQHAFQTTALIRALQTARDEGGVMAPAQFLWLRSYDRTLWYPLNNLGRQSFHMEALGAMSHYKAEKRCQRPIPKPKIDDALSSITEYMTSPIARPIPQLDYSQSKKRGIKKPKSAGVKKPMKPAKA